MSEISIALVVKVAAEFFEISKADLLSRRRIRNLFLPRHSAIWAARLLTTRSLPQIGRAFGRDHTTILHSVRTVEAAREADRSTRTVTNDLLEAVQVAALALEKLNARHINDVDGLAVAEAIIDDPMKVTTVSVNELYALAAATLHLSEQAPKAKLRPATNAVEQGGRHQAAISSVLSASRTFECARYSAAERAALEDLCQKLSNLRNAFEHPHGGQP